MLSQCRGPIEATTRRVSPTVKSSRRPPSWKMTPTRPAWTARSGEVPRSSIVPASGWVSPRTMSRVVDLPAPLGPRKATTSPDRMVRSRPLTATRLPNVLRRPRESIAGAGAVCPT